MKKTKWLAFFLILAASCLDEPDCYQLHNDMMDITFRVIGTGQVDSLLLRSSNGKFVPVSVFSDSLNYFERQGAYLFEGIDNKTYALSFRYTVKNQFVSEDCGSSFILSDLEILDHTFDSARVVNSTPTKTGGPNIDVYRCPETDTLTIEFNQLFATTNGATITNPRSDYISHQFEITNESEDVLYTGRAATVKLPVDLTKNRGVFTFKTGDADHTLEFTYDRVTEQLYRPCGVQTFVRNLTIGENTFDSVSYGLNSLEEPIRSLLDPQVANLRVFDCAPTNLLRVDFVSAPNIVRAVNIKSITASHLATDLVTAPLSTTTVTLPVDLQSDISTFTIVYEDDTSQILSVQYTRTALYFSDACPDPIITNLREVTEAANITVVPAGITLQFPAVKNVEITVN